MQSMVSKNFLFMGSVDNFWNGPTIYTMYHILYYNVDIDLGMVKNVFVTSPLLQ